jgi:hypothetical protein
MRDHQESARDEKKVAGQQRRKRVLNEFTLDNTAEKTLGLYEQTTKRQA